MSSPKRRHRPSRCPEATRRATKKQIGPDGAPTEHCFARQLAWADEWLMEGGGGLLVGDVNRVVCVADRAPAPAQLTGDDERLRKFACFSCSCCGSTAGDGLGRLVRGGHFTRHETVEGRRLRPTALIDMAIERGSERGAWRPRHHPRHAERKNPHARATQPPSNDLAANDERSGLRLHQKNIQRAHDVKICSAPCGRRVRSRPAAMCSSSAPIAAAGIMKISTRPPPCLRNGMRRTIHAGCKAGKRAHGVCGAEQSPGTGRTRGRRRKRRGSSCRDAAHGMRLRQSRRATLSTLVPRRSLKNACGACVWRLFV